MQKDKHEQPTLPHTTNREHTLSFGELPLPLPPLVLMLLLLTLKEGMTAAVGAGGLRRWKLTDNVDGLLPSQLQTMVSVVVKGRLKGT